MSELIIKDLQATIEGKQILKGVNLTIKSGEVHALMGPNGSGKSTLAYTLMGHPGYQVTGGSATFDGKNVLELPADQRAKLGLFLSFQYPTAIPGVTLVNFLRASLRSLGHEMPAREFMDKLTEQMRELRIDEEFRSRYLNEGSSGGEKKRMEILQLAMLKPKMAILDETDSGLDIDALRIVAEGVNRIAGPEMGVLVITHYSRILNHLKPHHVHVMFEGKIVKSGGPELADQIEKAGYDPILGVKTGDPMAAGATA